MKQYFITVISFHKRSDTVRLQVSLQCPAYCTLIITVIVQIYKFTVTIYAIIIISITSVRSIKQQT